MIVVCRVGLDRRELETRSDIQEKRRRDRRSMVEFKNFGLIDAPPVLETRSQRSNPPRPQRNSYYLDPRSEPEQSVPARTEHKQRKPEARYSVGDYSETKASRGSRSRRSEAKEGFEAASLEGRPRGPGGDFPGLVGPPGPQGHRLRYPETREPLEPISLPAILSRYRRRGCSNGPIVFCTNDYRDYTKISINSGCSTSKFSWKTTFFLALSFKQ